MKPDAVAGVPRLVWHYNEPFADSSALPSLALCEMARGFVTVALNGDGGDEAFLGYDRYLATAVLDRLDWVPRPVRALAGAAGQRAAARAWPNRSTVPDAAVHRGADPGAARPLRGVDDVLREQGQARAVHAGALAGARRHRLAGLAGRRLRRVGRARRSSSATAHTDVQLYLPDDLLVKMDIASMANSLEVRSPFLDHEVVEFAATLPAPLKLRGSLRSTFCGGRCAASCPRPSSGGPKMGFGVPIDHWFRHELREMAYDVLLDARARQRGYFRPEIVRRYLDEHVEGRAHHHPRLWSLLMLEQWHRVFIDARPASSAAPAACGA